MAKLIVFLYLLLSIVLSGCMAPGMGLASSTFTSTPDTLKIQNTRELTVFAAASLMDAFEEIGAAFEAAEPGVKVNFNFAGSQILRTQIEQGAAADVFASADHKNMDELVTNNLVINDSFQDFASNHLVVILPMGNSKGLDSLHDLAMPGIKLILADSSVPAGRYARQVLSRLSADASFGAGYEAAVRSNVVSNETDVRQVVTKVELGEADAGMVYWSDAVAAPELTTIPIPEAFNIVAIYPIAVLTASPNPDLAGKFISYVLSPTGQSILDKWGFTTK